jgi:HAD superfamily hydrolase (TIGR01509 family)
MPQAIVPTITAVLFDFDGVIVNSEPVHCRAYLQIARQQEIDLTEAEYYRDLIGYDDRGAWRIVLENHGRRTDDATIEELTRRKTTVLQEMARGRRIAALPGVEQLVRGLRRADVPLGICSGALRAEIELMLDGTGLRDDFAVITAAEDVDIGKPDPRGYVLTAQRISEKIGRSIAIEQCLVIEDAISVAIEARREGFAVLGVATTYPPNAWPKQIPTVMSLEPTRVREAVPNLPWTEE